jgi:hypothetical protein
MGIRLDIYQKVKKFSILDAAYLWLEKDPNEIKSYDVGCIEELITEHLNLRQKRWAVFLSQQDDPEKTIHKLVVENRKIHLRNSFDFLPISLGWEPAEERYKKSLSQDEKDKLWENAQEDPVTEKERQVLFSEMPPGVSSDVTREELIEVAEKLGEKPRFLFPEISKNNSETIAQNIEELPLHTKKRNSYLRLIKGLLKKQGINPGERGIAKSLVGIVKDAKQSLEADAIRGILKEVQNLEEDD